MIINKPEISLLKILRCDVSISVWRLYPLSGTSGLDIIYYAHTFFGQFIPCSFKRSYGRIRVKTKNRLLCQLCFHFQVFFSWNKTISRCSSV